jgi:hypothetical protein
MSYIDDLEKTVGCKLPPSVVLEALNENSPLFVGTDDRNFTFIAIHEYEELRNYMERKTISPLSQLPELKLLLTDDECRDFVGIFVSGPMLGRLSLMGHDSNIDCAPLYRSLNSFIEAIQAGIKTPETEWPYQVDYLNTGDELQTNVSKQDVANDMACVEQLEALIRSVQDPFRYRFLNSCIISLTPKENVERLVLMLESRDYHICGRACSSLGYYQYDKPQKGANSF